MILKTLLLKGPLPRINRKYVPSYNRRARKSYMRLSQEWEEKFGCILLQMQGQKNGFYTEDKIDLFITQSIHPRTDSDAILKGLFDSLEKSGVIKNDNQIKNYCVVRGPWSGEDEVIIQIISSGELLNCMVSLALEELDENKKTNIN